MRRYKTELQFAWVKKKKFLTIKYYVLQAAFLFLSQENSAESWTCRTLSFEMFESNMTTDIDVPCPSLLSFWDVKCNVLKSTRRGTHQLQLLRLQVELGIQEVYSFIFLEAVLDTTGIDLRSILFSRN